MSPLSRRRFLKVAAAAAAVALTLTSAPAATTPVPDAVAWMRYAGSTITINGREHLCVGVTGTRDGNAWEVRMTIDPAAPIFSRMLAYEAKPSRELPSSYDVTCTYELYPHAATIQELYAEGWQPISDVGASGLHAHRDGMLRLSLHLPPASR